MGMIVNALYNIIDRMYIGHIKDVGSLAITGVGLTLPIMTVLMAFSMLIGIGSASIISIRLGQKRKMMQKNIRKCVYFTLYYYDFHNYNRINICGSSFKYFWS